MTSRSANGGEGGRSTREAPQASGHKRAERSKRKEKRCDARLLAKACNPLGSWDADTSEPCARWHPA